MNLFNVSSVFNPQNEVVPVIKLTMYKIRQESEETHPKSKSSPKLFLATPLFRILIFYTGLLHRAKKGTQQPTGGAIEKKVDASQVP